MSDESPDQGGAIRRKRKIVWKHFRFGAFTLKEGAPFRKNTGEVFP